MARYLAPLARTAAAAAVSFGLAACSMADRLAHVGEKPEVTPIQNPVASPAYKPVSMPMPPPITTEREPSSLWAAGSRAFFKDSRAARVGDILTVLVQIADVAQLQNETKRTRANTDTADYGSLFGMQAIARHVLPHHTVNGVAVDPTQLKLGSTLSNDGTGSINRQETINLKVAAVVVQVLPNGNMVLHGHQEVRVNFEMRELEVAGVIRPEDIITGNTITYDKLAEARISYGGRGQLNDVQQPRIGGQVLDILLPF